MPRRRPWTGLNERVKAALPRDPTPPNPGSAAAEAELERLEQERAALAAVRIPDDTAALDAGLAAARTALEQARAAERAGRGGRPRGAAALAGARGGRRSSWPASAAPSGSQRAAGGPWLEQEPPGWPACPRQAEDAVTDAADRPWRQLRGAAGRRGRPGAEAAERRTRDLSAEHAALAAVAVPDGR